MAAYDSNLSNQIDQLFVQIVRGGNLDLAAHLSKDL